MKWYTSSSSFVAVLASSMTKGSLRPKLLCASRMMSLLPIARPRALHFTARKSVLFFSGTFARWRTYIGWETFCERFKLAQSVSNLNCLGVQEDGQNRLRRTSIVDHLAIQKD